MSSFQITQIFFLPFYASVKARTPFLLGAIFRTFVLAKIWNFLIVFFQPRGQRLVPGSGGFRSKNFDPGGVGPFFCGSGWVGLAIYGLGLKNFP